jgi:uncharacterized membrane protein (DUF4010 family)
MGGAALGLILLAMTVILLPLLPDHELAPWFPVNPREVWLITIMFAALSFAGYVVIRVAARSSAFSCLDWSEASCRRRP